MQSIFTPLNLSPCRAYPLSQRMPGFRRERFYGRHRMGPANLLPLAVRPNIMHHDTAQEVRTLAVPETPKLMVDVVIPSEAGVVLIRRGSDPFEGQWALPGGFVEVEETGLAVEISRLIGVYSEPDRDPRGHNVSVAFLANVLGGQMQAASDASEVAVLDPDTVELAFDHSRIIADAMV